MIPFASFELRADLQWFSPASGPGGGWDVPRSLGDPQLCFHWSTLACKDAIRHEIFS